MRISSATAISMALFLAACSGKEDGNDTATVEVDPDAPVVESVAITPSEGAYNDSMLACEASASDPTGEEPSIVVTWEVAGEEVGSGSTLDLSGGEFWPDDEVQCVATATNSAGLDSSGSASVVLENRDPVIELVEIVGWNDEFRVGVMAGCAATFSDPDGESLEASYVWELEGEVVHEDESITVSPENSNPDTNTTCIVTVEDGYGGSATASADMMVVNTPPTIDSISFDPEEFRETDTVTCVVEGAFDADEDEVELNYAWMIDFDWIAHTESTIDGEHFDKGLGVECYVTPFDGREYGEQYQGPHSIVLNSLPTAPTATLTPSSPEARRDDIVCEVTTESTDVDPGDTMVYSFDWTVDGVAWSGDTSTTTHAGDTISGSDTYLDEVWECTVSVTDGDDTVEGNSVSETVVTPISWSDPVDLATSAMTFFGASAGDAAGATVAGLGDVDGDGLDDIAIAATKEDSGGDSAGAVYIFYSAGIGSSGTMNLGAADHVIVGDSEYDFTGDAISTVGDVDGDGFDDFIIGAYGNSRKFLFEDSQEDKAGEAYLFLGASLGSAWEIGIDEADYVITWDDVDLLNSSHNGSGLGYDVAGGGDIDGDGLGDLLISAPYVDCDAATDGDGCVFLVYGSSLGGSSYIDLDDADVTISAELSSSMTGASVSMDGDFDGDGLSDILVGAPQGDRYATDDGAAYLILASSIGSASNLDLADADHIFRSWSEDEHLGSGVGFAGDVDGDGLDDLLIGSNGYDNGSIEDVGIVYLFLASSLGSDQEVETQYYDYRVTGRDAGDELGSVVDSAGDLDGDGLADIIVGTGYFSHVLSNGGGAFLFLSSNLNPASSKMSVTSADYEIQGAAASDYAGCSAVGVGDVNGDGVDDILVGASGADTGGSGAGEAYLLIP